MVTSRSRKCHQSVLWPVSYTHLDVYKRQVYYRVATEDGQVDIGNAELPLPPGHLVTGRPQFTDASYFGEPVRVGTYARLLDPPLPGYATGQRLVIQVAETLESRQAFTLALVLQAIARDVLLLGVATSLMVLAVGWALRLLARLRNDCVLYTS